ncbi:hypothetical protein, partial [Streptococcus pneumoniae]|uniref:hypothetical protein n=1 Tax=Streptococcus pneumoniae TaxID=1313 RepID=UPI00139D79C0
MDHVAGEGTPAAATRATQLGKRQRRKERHGGEAGERAFWKAKKAAAKQRRREARDELRAVRQREWD